MEEILNIGITAIPAITVLCFIVGLILKSIKKLDNSWIPPIIGVVGAILGILSMLFTPDFPAKDFLSSAAIGAISGLAATGVDQVVKQQVKKGGE